MAGSRLTHVTPLLALVLVIFAGAHAGGAADSNTAGTAGAGAAGMAATTDASFEPFQGASALSFAGQLGGGSLAVEATENAAYVGAGPGVHVLDTAALGAPRVLGRSEPFGDTVYDLALAGDRLLAAAGADGLRVLEASDTATLATRSVITMSTPAKGVAVSGDRAFVVAPGSGLTELSLAGGSVTRTADWAAPYLSGPVDASSTGLVFALSYLAAGTGAQGAVVIDARSGVSITIGASFGAPVRALDYDDCTNHLALATNDGIDLYDLSSTNQPARLGEWRGGVATAVRLTCDRAYVATTAGGILLDVSDPATPIEIAPLRLAGWASGLAVAGSRLVAAVNRGALDADDAYELGGGLDVIELSGAAPARRSLYEIPSGQLRDIDVSGATVLATEGDPAILLPGRAWSFDVSDPSRPVPSGSADLEGEPYRAGAKPPFGFFTSSEGFLVTTTGPDGRLRAFKRSVGIDLGDADLAISAARMYAVGGPEDFAVYDVGYPPDVAKVALELIPNMRGATSIEVENGRAYAAGEEGVFVLDVREPSKPRSLARLHRSGPATDIAAFGGFALAADRLDGLRIIDATDVADIGEVSHRAGPSMVAVAATGGVAYSLDLAGTVQLLDLSDPLQPVVAGSADAPALARTADGSAAPVLGADMAAVADVVLVAHPARGLMSYRAAGHVGPTPTPVADPDLVYLPAVSKKSAVSPARFNLLEIGKREGFNTSTWGLDVVGDFAYLGRQDGSVYKISVVNVRDPAAPVEVGLSEVLGGRPVRLVFRGGFVYAVTETAGLQVVDARDPALLAIVGRLATTREFTQIALSGDGSTAYVIESRTLGGPSDLVVVDLRVAQTPLELGRVTVTADDRVSGIAILAPTDEGGGHLREFAHVSLAAAGVAVVDVHDPAAPVVLDAAACTTPGGGCSFQLGGAMEPTVARNAWPSMRNLVALVNRGSETTPGGLWMLDSTEARAITEVGSLVSIDWPEVQGAHQISWLGSRLVAVTEDDVRLYDVSDPLWPHILAEMKDQYSDIWEVVLTESRVYFSDTHKGLVMMALIPDRAGTLPNAARGYAPDAR